MIVIGTDTHKYKHALAAVDDGTGRVRGSREIDADDAGHLAAVKWARGLDDERVWAIEDCRHVSRRLEQALIAAGERVVRVASHRMGASRKGEREPGKSDEIDSLAVARAVVKDGVECFPAAFLDERVMEIRLLADHRNDLIAERTRIQNRLRWHLVALCPELEASLKKRSLSETRQLDRIDRRLRRLAPESRVRVARAQVAQIRSLTRQAKTLETELLALVKAHRPQLLAETGCGFADRGDPDRPDRGSRAVSDRRELRPPIRHSANQMLLRPTPTAPAQPRRGPPAQPRAAHHRDHPRPPRPGHPRVPRTQTSRRQNQERRAPLPQTPPRPPLLAAPRRATAPSRPSRHTRARDQARAAHHAPTPRPR